MFEDEISPEELFNRFFGGGGFGGGGGPFGMRTYSTPRRNQSTDLHTEGGFGGPQFVFNMGGGPGFTVHRMGGGVPRRRPRTGDEPEQGGLGGLAQLLPLLLLFVLPLLS